MFWKWCTSIHINTPKGLYYHTNFNLKKTNSEFIDKSCLEKLSII